MEINGKYRVVRTPRAHPSHTLLYAYFNRSGSKEPFSFPGAVLHVVTLEVCGPRGLDPLAQRLYLCKKLEYLSGKEKAHKHEHFSGDCLGGMGLPTGGPGVKYSCAVGGTQGT